jgi:hypothetical protein
MEAMVSCLMEEMTTEEEDSSEEEMMVTVEVEIGAVSSLEEEKMIRLKV